MLGKPKLEKNQLLKKKTGEDFLPTAVSILELMED
jgi:hypothetical protein